MIDTQTIKQLADLRAVLSYYGIEPDYHGFIPCFAHKEKTASMKIYPNNTCHCFGCGADFDVISVVQFFENCRFKEACQRVCAICGLPCDKELTPREKAALRAKMKAIQRQKEEERKRKEEQDRTWKQLCEKLHDAERRYHEIVPRVNTPEFEAFRNDFNRVDKAMALAAEIANLNARLDKMWAQGF